MGADDRVVTMVAPRARRGQLDPIDGRAVRITGGLWADRIAINRDRTIGHGLAQLEASGALGNFRNAARGTGLYVGGQDDAGTVFPFLDSDVYKWLEAVGWELGRAPDPELGMAASAVVDLVAAAQRPDGYLNTYVQLSGRAPFSDLQWGHELYCGHLLQAAVAWHRAIGDDRLLAVARRAIERIDQELGPAGRDGVDGHPEIEMALVELSRIDVDERALALARHLLDQRGKGLLREGRFGAGYWQDRLPVREAPTVVGHAVRQLYLDCGAVDVAVETGDDELLQAVIRRWDEMRAARTYLTGGVGSRHRDESFGAPYELPSDRAYTETCAAIGSVMLAWRLLLATGEERFADAIERAMLDAVLPGLSLDGQAFYYVNPLQRRPAVAPESVSARRPWYPCACCPPNLMRTLSSFEQLLATTDAGGLQLHQYATGDLSATLAGGRVGLRIQTDYPWDGHVSIRVEHAPAQPWTLGLRVPEWCQAWSLRLRGDPVAGVVRAGRIVIERAWAAGDHVELDLEMPARLTVPDPRIDAVRGTVAVERGPLVYCLEDADLPAGVAMADVAIDASAEPRVEMEL
ncbi:MAG TPA: beta-L-arabinofuranosidase domain-containing protein, partial [Candidatus Limnocylindrales bacterium]|nr:beta-L-arabinofuranosidase domain-containing protein [Candidatus Limnocylindrales bacterium]